MKPTPDEVAVVIQDTYDQLPPKEQRQIRSIIRRKRRSGRYAYGLSDEVGIEILGKIGMLMERQDVWMRDQEPIGKKSADSPE